MTIYLYKNLSDDKEVDKELANELVISDAVARDEIAMESCYFRLARTIDLSQYNYAYIPEHHRYYFAVCQHIRHGIWNIDCAVDAVSSWKEGVRALTAIIDRQYDAEKASPYIEDGTRVNTVKAQTEIINFPSGFNNNAKLTLVTTGTGALII